MFIPLIQAALPHAFNPQPEGLRSLLAQLASHRNTGLRSLLAQLTWDKGPTGKGGQVQEISRSIVCASCLRCGRVSCACPRRPGHADRVWRPGRKARQS